jgi:hypothetical protein
MYWATFWAGSGYILGDFFTNPSFNTVPDWNGCLAFCILRLGFAPKPALVSETFVASLQHASAENVGSSETIKLSRAGLPDFTPEKPGKYTKNYNKIYKMAIKYTKWQLNRPKGHKLYQHMSLDTLKFTQIVILCLKIYHLATICAFVQQNRNIF